MPPDDAAVAAPEPTAIPTPLLRLGDLEAGYGQVQVLWGIQLEVREAETVVLLGANGAGKTTTLKAIIGLVAATGGRILFRGEDITALRTDRRVRRGIAFMSETCGFPGLTIDENIRIGAQFLPARELSRRCDELYDVFPALAGRRRSLASSLSGGQRKMLGLAKALAGRPRLVIMDEPSAGLSPLLVSTVIDVLRQLRGEGVSYLIAEQNVKFLGLADRVYTVDGGRIGFSGTVAQMRADDAVRRAYFGLRS
jgi:branched-chain amino acid transport system ATP-binding protein